MSDLDRLPGRLHPGSSAAQTRPSSGSPASSSSAAGDPGSRQARSDEPTGLGPISLPKGGGAIRGIDEKLTVGLATGAAQLSVPIPTTSSRPGGTPSLTLAYDSGAGNGVFGLGWRLSVPSVTRKTSRGLPLYRDSLDSDVFVLSDAEDLVPFPDAPGPDPTGLFTVRRYRPRVESGFARIERWREIASGETHWRTISRTNVTSIFGGDASSRVADPADPGRVFSWLLDLTYDDRGNAVVYEYKPEDSANVPDALHEQARVATANRYLKRILYGNVDPYSPGDAGLPASWRFQVVFDYGDHAGATPVPTESTAWPCRPDSFSTYRACFEIRTHRLCRRALVFHSFPDELAAPDVLVGSTDFTYTTDAPADPSLPSYSQLSSVVQQGYIRNLSDGTYAARALPPLDLEYSAATLHDVVAVADADVLANLPAGVDGRSWRWMDLDGEGLPGVLTEDDRAWYYKRNVSAYTPDGSSPGARFEPLEFVASIPVGPAGRSPQLLDLHGDGHLCAVEMAPPAPGYHARTDDGWDPFKPFLTTAAIDWSNPNVRTVDLDGDGLADVLVTDDDAFTWFEWLDEDGFALRDRIATDRDENLGPALVLAEGDSAVYLGDMSGDGLSDLVRIRNGEVAYWPNLGYGRFGAKVTMESSPWFDDPETFEPRRIRLADIDGSGTSDLLYLSRTGPTIWFNDSGNGLTAPTELRSFPPIDDVGAVETIDLLGAGTSCLAWSSALPGEAGRQLRYVDLMGSVKPYLLTRAINNLGAETTLTYSTSTRYYLEDRLAGRSWATRLAFPVHVVSRKEVLERVTGTQLVCDYRYHHGFFDGVEREFRGFGMVEQTDAESVPSASGVGTFSSTPAVDAGEFVLPPVRTCTFFHTGAYVDGEEIAATLAAEYFEDPQAADLGGTRFVGAASPEEMREACRALRGRVLRTEVYADDGTAEVGVPYTVTDHRYEVRLLQPPAGSSYGSVYACDLETRASNYERNAADPRVTHELTLEVDDFGTVTKSASLAYARRTPGPIAEQGDLLATYTEHVVTNVPDQADWYRIGVPVEMRQYELTGLGSPDDSTPFDPDTLGPEAAGAATISFDATPTAGIQKRVIGRTRTIYRADDLSGPLVTGGVQSKAIVDRTYTLTVTPGLAARVFGPKAADPASIATTEAGFVDLDGDGNWWAPTPRAFYSPDPGTSDPAFAGQHFFLPQGQVDAFGAVTSVAWENDLVVVQRTDPVGNQTTALVNYRLLRQWLLTDPNENRTGVRFDELGTVTAVALMGKELPAGDEGDHLDLTTSEASAADDPTSRYDYDLDAYRTWAANPAHDPEQPTPVFAHSRDRVRHQDPATPWLEKYAYTDGMGRIVLAKAQAEPGDVPVVAPDGTVSFTHSDTRWVGTGRIVYDNKDNPVKAYEPFFDGSSEYTVEPALVLWGVTAITRYDPLSRAVRVDNPNGTFTSIEFDSWRRVSADENDNCLGSSWYSARSGGALGPAEQDAASKAASQANTPQVVDFDSLGRARRTIADGEHGQFVTSATLDIGGRTIATWDALGRTAQTTDYDLAGGALHSLSIDAGERWVLRDVAGQPVREWDSVGYEVRRSYDQARRPTEVFVSLGGATFRLAETADYGEAQSDAVQNNLRGLIYEQRDGAGLATTALRDFKGNVVRVQRQMLADIRADDWSSAPALSPETLTTQTEYDALNRVVAVRTPDASVLANSYNERSLPSTVDVVLRGIGAPTAYVRSVTYNARAQRESIEYGNGAVTTYTYNPDTFRLARLVTTRPTGPGPVQDLAHTYDPVGNVTQIVDAAQSTVFFSNQLVPPAADYTYDSIYRLVTAKGREHIGQVASAPASWDDAARRAVPLPTDSQAMRNYTETYVYDLVGNIATMSHAAAGDGWSRTYAYDEPHAPPSTNRLTSTTVGSTTERYGYDANGNMTSMPQLTGMDWDFRNRLLMTSSQMVADGDAQSTWYRYAPSGGRVRKATLRPDGSVASERIYHGNYEVYRELSAAGVATLVRETLVIGDMSGRVALLETTTIDADHPAAPPATATRYQHANHLGSACVELDENAAVITYEEYYPYGATSFQAGRSVAEVSLKRYRYTGMEHDDESGLGYHGARYYAAWLGRWTSPDPGGLIDGPDLYAYCRGNPIVLHDPSGSQGTSGAQDDDGPSFHYEEVPPDPSGRPSPSLRLVYDSPSFQPLELHPAAGDASVPFVLPWYNSPGILGPNTGVLSTQPNFSVPGAGQSHAQFPSAVPGSPAGSYLTMTWPAAVGQSQFTFAADPTGAPNAWTYQHQFGPRDPMRSGEGVIISGSFTGTGIPSLTTDPIFGVGGLYLHEWTFGGEKEQPAASFGFNVGGGGGRGLQLTTGGMGWYGDVILSGAASFFPAGYYRDTPAADASYRGTLVQPSQVPRLTISAGAYATGFFGAPIDSTTHGMMVAGAGGLGAGATFVTPRVGVNTRLFVSGYVGFGLSIDNAASGGGATGFFGSLGAGFLFGAPPTTPRP